MYALFRTPTSSPRVGSVVPPEHPYLQRTFQSLLTDVMAYYHHAPKRVASEHLFCRLLTILPMKWEMDDRQYLRYLDNTASTWTRRFDFVSPMYKGKVHESGVTLGKQSDEVIIEHHTGIPDDLEKVGAWRDWQPFRYLSHTRYDLQLPVLNNQMDVKGNGVALLDVPLLALQFRRWQLSQKKTFEQREAVFRFVGGYVLPNALPSYLDIAVFNRLTRMANGQPLRNYPAPHPFYVTDLSQRVDGFCQRLLTDNPRRATDPKTFMTTTPLITESSLMTLCQRLPLMPITHNNEWALIMARLPYLRYVVDHGVVTHKTDRTHINVIYETLIDARNDRIFTGVGSQRIIQSLKYQLDQLIETLSKKGHGW